MDSGYAKYVKQLDSIAELRGENKTTASLPVSEEVAKIYMNAYQGDYTSRSVPQTFFLKLSKDNIAFLYKQMDIAGLDSLAFAFGKYDTTGFSHTGLNDPVYNDRGEKMKGRSTVIIGEWGKLANGKKGPKPFSVKGRRFSFYDDWHNEDP